MNQRLCSCCGSPLGELVQSYGGVPFFIRYGCKICYTFLESREKPPIALHPWVMPAWRES